MKKTLSKVAHNQPIFFSTYIFLFGPKPAQISDIFHKNLPLGDFSVMILVIMLTLNSELYFSTYATQNVQFNMSC